MRRISFYFTLLVFNLSMVNCPPGGGGGDGGSSALVLALGGGSSSPTTSTSSAEETVQQTPTIRVSESANNLANSATFDLGSAVQNTSGTLYTFTILNNGRGTLTLSSSPAVQITGTDAAQFTVTQPSSSSLSSLASTTFSLRFSPQAGQSGTKSAQIRIASNDPSTSTYILNLTAKATLTAEPEIDVRQSTSSLTSGSSSYDFGSVRSTLTGSAVTFTIRNTGTANLTLTIPPSLTGANANQFTVDASLMSSPVPVNGTTSFTVTFAPTSEGTKNANISIANNDTDEGPFLIAITGFATAAPAPEINVQLVSNSNTILDDSGTFSFSNVQEGQSGTAVQFRIQNLGDANLTLSGSPIVTLGGANANQFSVTTQPSSSTIAPSGSVIFAVTFSPTSSGTKSATISFANNDSNENPYNFSISGIATVAPAPEINVQQSSTNIASGGTFSGIGSVRVGTTSAATSFTIQNLGNATLSLTGSPRVSVSGTNASEFTVATQPASASISTSGTGTFTVTFSPTSNGAKTAILTIASNDSDEGSYTINLSATGTVPTSTCTPSIVNGTRTSNAGSQANFFGSLPLYWGSAIALSTSPSSPSVIYYVNQPHSVTASNGVVFNYLILNSNYFFSRDGVGTTTYSGMYPYGRNNTEYLGSSAPSFSPDSSNFFSIEINTGVSLSSTNASYSIVQNCNPSLDEERTFTSSAGSDNTSGLGKVWTYRKKLKVRLIFISGTYDTPTEAGIQTAVNRMKSIYAQDSVKIDLEFTATTVTNSEFQTLANLSDDTGNVTGSLTKMYVSTAAAQSADSLNIYFTANNSQTAGVLGISAGIPGVPGITGTKKSGMVVFIEPHRSSGAAGSSLSTTDQTFMGDTMAHEAGHFLGLFHTNERGGFNSSSSNPLNRRDTLTDTPYCLSTRDVNSNGTVDINECSGTGFTNSGASNLMFWAGDGVTAQTQLTGEQGWILRRFPIVY